MSVTAVLVIGHGSRREEANEDVRQAALDIGRRGPISLVMSAFLEIAHPTIAEGFAQLVEMGATHVIVHPYFLSPGRHTRGDIPVEVKAAASLHSNLTYEITEPLSAHPLVIDASIERIRRATESRRNSSSQQKQAGKVYLVGAGPGTTELLTVKGLRLLKEADVIIYDYLVDQGMLTHADPHARQIYVGKIGGSQQTPQEQINSLLIEHARKGRCVVRLKGGDPLLFGRGAEEAQALRASGIPYEVVPGVSSAFAAPAYAGIPLTHRGLSSSVTILTGARAGDGNFSEDLFRGLDADTLVILMGLSHIRQITQRLIQLGRSAETPAAVIRWGCHDAQQVVIGSLQNISDKVEEERLRAPAVIVIGEVVRLRAELDWFTKRLVQENFLEVAA